MAYNFDLLESIFKKIERGIRLTKEDAINLFKVQGIDLYRVLELADYKRQQQVGDVVSYVLNYNLNITNVCVNECKFCAFACSEGSKEAYLLTFAEVEKRLQVALEHDITEICFVSGLHPNFDFEFYASLIENIRKIDKSLHLHGVTPEELKHALANEGLSYQKGYQQLKEIGLNSVPGTASEILDDEIREKICPSKIKTEEWIAAITAAHNVGLKSTATIMYGHLEGIEERVEHLSLIRDIQDQTGGFTEFIPLSFMPYNTELYRRGWLQGGATGREDLLMIAVSRLFLDNIDNIQASWVKYGPKLAQFMLQAGANDLGGTLFNEKITKKAGGKNGEYLSVEQLQSLIRDLNREPKQRGTIY
ncbi:7,8-didemethyl-8-hydroxy-5-deazariboflavin synthase subunit CofH [Natroniella sulfidigena]|uniref:7,8-didemethyl-8-hydroxy-5-deazariboflavin synthase subunit CofH n=1 Tax=Natroniella sulfidigena TaxID=723921 RepID=UPI00200A7F19|nr:7,8-didemethyl-8-hydroxy-5-deazariboflavin synthase subunit CofH [Natroniella sulfidigena]MCK8818194.1 7,8-didemethyl-8-hydroxy-5-deazariboflavin synthase subunit CofH [Natroniella sulfidigena]